MKNIIRLLFSFKGKIGRLKLFYGHLTLLLVVILPWRYFLTPQFEQQQMQGTITLLGLLAAAFILLGVIVSIWSGLALGVKRLRDLDMSVWWMIALLIPSINIIFGLFLQFFPGISYENRKKIP